MSKTHIRPAKLSDAAMYVGHLQRHGLESGRDGDLIFMPFENRLDQSTEGFTLLKESIWEKPVIEAGWERAWVLTDEDQIFGDLTLHNSPPIAASLHRATMMMGIERNHRKKGYGTKLIQTAIDWARKQKRLEWIDLQVFEHNEPAKDLYITMGFYAVGTIEDYFRLFDQKISDTAMVLKLK